MVKFGTTTQQTRRRSGPVHEGPFPTPFLTTASSSSVQSTHRKNGASQRKQSMKCPDKRRSLTSAREKLGPARILDNAGGMRSPVLQLRYKILSWLLNYTQSCARLTTSSSTKRGITTFRVFFLAAELIDLALKSNLHETLNERGTSFAAKDKRETYAWCLGLAAFNLAVKIEENRFKFDYYDLSELIAREGHLPGINAPYRGFDWKQEVLNYESKLLELLDWRVGEVYKNTSLGQLESLLTQGGVHIDDAEESEKQIQIAALVLQLTTLLLPDWVIEGVPSSEKHTGYLVHCLRAHAAWKLATQFNYHETPVSEGSTTESEPSKLLTRDRGQAKVINQIGHDYLLKALADADVHDEQAIEEAFTKSHVIQDHMRALMEYLSEFSTRMEAIGYVDYYQLTKTATNRDQRVKRDRLNSFLIPIVSAHRNILKELSQCFDSADAHLSSLERVKSQTWILSTFRSSLGYAIRCSHCFEYGHNKRSCFCDMSNQ